MKPIFPLLLAFLGFAFFPFFSVAIPHENEVEKSKKVNYPATAETVLQLKNQFGQIHIEPGPEDEISLRADFRAWASSKDAAYSVLDRLSIEHGKEGNTVYLHTEIKSMSTRNAEVGFEVNYAVIVPLSLAMEVENKFGHVFLEEHQGKLKLHLEHGNLHAEKLSGDATKVLNVKFGNIKLDEVENAEVNIVFGKLKVRKATNKLYINGTDGGAVEIDEAKSVQLELKRATLEIGRVADLEAEVLYGSTEIEEVTGSLKLESKYGGCEVERVASTARKIDVECDFGSVELGFAPGLRVHYSVACNFGTFKNSLPAVDTQQKEEATLSESHKGKAGKGSAVVDVKVEVRKGDIHFVED